MRCEMIICAEKIIIDASGGRKISAINIMDDIFSQSFPMILPLMIYVKLSREDISLDNDINVFMEIKIGNEILGKNPISFEFQEGLKTGATIINTNMILIPNPGDLYISLYKNDDVNPFHYIKYNLQQTPQSNNIN